MASQTVETKFLLTAQDRASSVITSVKSEIEKVGGAAAGMKAAFIALAAAAPFAALASKVSESTGLADSLGKLSQRTGIATESLSALRYQAELSDVSFDELQSGLKKFNVNIAEAAGGNKQALATFQAMGLSQNDLQEGLSDSEGLLRKVADRFAGYSDGASKTALAVDLFGKSGDRMIVMLNEGSKGFDTARKDLEKFGGVIGGDFAQKSAAFNDNLTRLRTLSEAGAIAIGEKLVPQLNHVIEAFIQGKREGDSFFAAFQRAVQVATIGTDQQINDRRLVELTEEIARQEKIVAETRANADRPNQTARAAMMRRYESERAELQRLQDELKTTMTYRKQLERESEATAAAAAGRSTTRAPTVARDAGAGGDPGAAFLDAMRKRVLALEEGDEAAARFEATTKKLTAAQQLEFDSLLKREQVAKSVNEQRKIDEATWKAEIERNVATLKGVEDYITALDLETKAMKFSNEERLVAIQVAKLETNERMRGTAEIGRLTGEIRRSVEDNARARIKEENQTPFEKYEATIQRLDKLFDEGRQDWETYRRAVLKAEEELRGHGTQTDKLAQTARDLGFTFSSAFEKAILGGEKLSDTLQALGRDIAAIVLRRTVIEDIADSITKAVKGDSKSGGSSSGSSLINTAIQWIKDILPFEDGGIMTSSGPVQLRRYARGGIADRPQLALFGEGSTPEAYVPLPDGYSIPVTLRSDFGGRPVNVVVNNNAAPDSMASARVRNDPMRGLTVEVLVEKITSIQSRQLQQGGGLAPIIERQYGLNRAAGAFR